MDNQDYAEKWAAEREAEATRRIKNWFDRHPDKKYYPAYYPLAGGHFISELVRIDSNRIMMRTDTGGLVDLMHYGRNVYSDIGHMVKED